MTGDVSYSRLNARVSDYALPSSFAAVLPYRWLGSKLFCLILTFARHGNRAGLGAILFGIQCTAIAFPRHRLLRPPTVIFD